MTAKFTAITSLLMIMMSGKLIAQTTQAADSLAGYRQQIDSLDKQLIFLLGQRMQVVEQVGMYKARHNMPALQQARFDAILQKNILLGQAQRLSKQFVTAFMEAIHQESLSKEKALHAQ